MVGMILDERPYTFDRVTRMALTVGLIAGLVWLAGLLSPVLIPFAVAVMLAYLIHPLVCLVQRRVPNRIAASLLTVFGLGGLLAGLGWWLLALLIEETIRFGTILSDLAAEKEVYQRLVAQLPEDLVLQLRSIAGDWRQLLDYVSGAEAWRLLSQAAPLPLGILQQVGGLLAAGLGLSVILMYLIFLLIDFDWFRNRWQTVIPANRRPAVLGFLQEWNLAMGRHFRAQALIAACVGVVMAVGFWLIGLPLGILFGLFVGLLNMVPYLQLISLPLAAILALMQVAQGEASLWWALGGTGLVYLVAQVIQDGLLVPRFMGQAFGLRPVVILLAIMVWGQLLGLLGLILALPLTCLGWAWYARWVLEPARQASEGEAAAS
jgi:predicted PurR-regulated permease PerM